jgi:hypothetical protein
MTLLPDQIHSVQPVQQAHQTNITPTIKCNSNNINSRLSLKKRFNSNIESQIGNNTLFLEQSFETNISQSLQKNLSA